MAYAHPHLSSQCSRSLLLPYPILQLSHCCSPSWRTQPPITTIGWLIAFKTLSQTTQSGHPLVIPETLLKFISQWLTAVITRRSSMWVGSPLPVTTVTPRGSEHRCKESRQRGGREPRPGSSPFFGVSLYSAPILLSIRK